MSTARMAVVSIAFLGSAALTPPPVTAQTYPVKPVRLILMGTAGGGVDVIGRPIAQKLSESAGQPFVAENRPGAAGIVAGQVVAAAPPDGYTLLLGTVSGLAISPFLMKKRPYDPERDLSPVTLIALTPLIMTVHPALPVKSVKELIALGKAKPGQLMYASNGAGSLSHLTTELFCNSAGIALRHLPYKGGTPAMIDTVSGQAQLIITAAPTLLPQVRASRLRALAVTSRQRSSVLPELPSVAESALPQFEANQWYAVYAPRNVPPPIVDKLVAEIRKATENPAVKTALLQEGADVAVNGPDALAALQRADAAKWQRLIRESQIVID